MIEIKHLTKSFGDKTVLHDINTTFETGKTNLIIGQSGSGKTVLMKNIIGLLTPTSGEVLFDGRDTVTMSKKAKVELRREMGMVFQGSALFDSLTVLENVRFPLDMFSSLNSRERDKRAQECLERVNLLDAQNKYPAEISGGMQKRLSIACALASRPTLLLLDEPDAALDLVCKEDIREYIRLYCAQGNTVLLATHEEADFDLCSKLILLKDGHARTLAADTPVKEIIEYLS